MSTRTHHDIRNLARHFALPGDYVTHAPCGRGHINDTYEVRFNQAGTSVRYIIQRINHEVFRQPADVMSNIDRVTRHIAKKLEAIGRHDVYRRVLSVIPTRDGRLWHEDSSGNHWRVYFYVEGAEAHDHVNSTALAEEAAEAFGTFQKHVADMDGPRLADTIPDFHNTVARYATFERAVDEDRASRKGKVADAIAWVRDHKADTERLYRLQSEGNLPERITHNDTKINNVMIDSQTGEGICIMDLDTVMHGLALYDFGDLVRTTTISTAEDERDVSKVTMRMPMFQALVRGYLRSAREFLSPGEVGQLAFSGHLITLETGIRFLTDHLNGDVYFKTHRPDHNLERFRVQQALVESIKLQADAMERTVEEIASQPNAPKANI
jgi:aminoglycoside phosphotransferase (APT) family kinase protein